MTENRPFRNAPLRDRMWHGAPRRPDAGARDRGRTAAASGPFTQTVDGRLGIVRPGGRLTAQAGELLRETVEALHGSGHTRVRLDLGGLDGADDGGLDALCALQSSTAAPGRSLVVVRRVEPVD
ncbi:STAS domain-containing protein [Blastococcus colisei]|uniref:STAS domain-containing protein n=1 Tax=Blastococcus colisei TaxID=1564162 RepID=A0A543PG76_9ACTN|nr:STAS domain-containing protein [Blastococcus colisei]TQN43074.1 STAS domain-containing protein [Blastococcus colisei]